MTTKALILDLDDTLVNTAMLANLRQQRRWGEIFTKIGTTLAYSDAVSAVNSAYESGILIGVVTRSISNYAKAVLDHHQIRYHTLVAYHDCGKQKPAADPVLLCMQRLGVTKESAVGLGDSYDDCSAYLAAGIAAYGAAWSDQLARDAPWTQIISANEFTKLAFDCQP